MKTFARTVFRLLLLAICAGSIAYFLWYKGFFGEKTKGLFAINISAKKIPKENKSRLPILESHASDLQTFAKKNHYNEKLCFMIDMGIESGRQRFFVYDLEKDSVLNSGLVAHGQGSLKSEIEFSNEPGSYCTSLGRYKIGGAYQGKFGLAYKLSGLDKTNSNALNRFVVLHSHACVPDMEVAPSGICMSQGCPTVSPAFLQVLAKYVDKSERPVLLEIFK